MTEYWVNVYRNGLIGSRKHYSIMKCICYSYLDGPLNAGPIYRVHVKLKDKEEIAMRKLVKALEFQPQDIYEKYMHGGR